MTIWLLILLIMASLAGFGYRQGGVRVAFSFLGILLGALLAGPLGKLTKPLLIAVGLKNPVLATMLAVMIAFIVISILFKVAGFSAHQKIDVYFKYKAGDLRLALYERLIHRLGLCMGLFNGAVYAILVCWVIYVLGYWTYQTANSESDPTVLKVFNRLAKDLETTGFHKVVRAIDPVKDTYYDTADVAGLIYNNSLLEARLSRYPAFLDLAEMPEIQGLAADQTFTEMRLSKKPIMSLLSYPGVQAVVNNPELMKTLNGTVKENIKDLRTFLETGKSPNFDGERILGRWQFDLNFTMIMIHRAQPTASNTEMTKVKKLIQATMAKTSFVATPKQRAIIKNVPKVLTASGPRSAELQTVQGEWKKADPKYLITFSGLPEVVGSIENDRLTMTGAGMEMAFIRED